MMFGIDDPSAINGEIKRRIDDYCQITYNDPEPRYHLGASIIGHECSRYLYYSFRWYKLIKPDGRMSRLFNRGHKEEARIVEWLTAAGIQIYDIDQNTGKQFKFSGYKGHYGGSLDGIGVAPWINNGAPFLCEFKTHNTKSFSRLVNDGGVKATKVQHFAQMSVYGYAYQFSHALYFPVNKNDDDIHPLFTELDYAYAQDLERKAIDVIDARQPPRKLSEHPEFMACRICDFRDVCHNGETPNKSCRSCRHSEPIENGEWRCNFYQRDGIPKEVQVTGCENYNLIP